MKKYTSSLGRVAVLMRIVLMVGMLASAGQPSAFALVDNSASASTADAGTVLAQADFAPVAVSAPASTEVAPFVQVAKTATNLGNCQDVRIVLTVNGAGDPVVNRRPLDVMLVLDVSGSMAGTKLTDAKAAANSLVGQLNPAIDRVGLVSFSDNATLNRVLTSTFSAVTTTVNGLASGGFTNIAGGILTAQTEITAHARAEAVHVIVLLSDGVANVDHNGNSCTTSPTSATTCTTDAVNQGGYAKYAGTIIFSIGLGLGNTATDALARTTLESIASSLSNYYEAPTSAELQGIFNAIVLAITNSAGTNFTVHEVLPANVSYIASSGHPTPTSIVGQTLNWSIPILGITETKSFTLDVHVNPSSPITDLIDVYPSSGVTYTNYQTQTVFLPFPLTGLHVNSCATATPTSTPTSTSTSTPTNTPTSTSTNTPTSTPTNTPTSTSTNTPTSTPTNTPTATATDTPTSTPTDTPTATATDTPTATATDTPTATATDTPTATATDTPTATPTDTPTSTPTDTPTSTPTDTPTSTPTDTPTSTPTDTPTSTPTDTPTATATDTPTATATDTPTSTPTNTPTATPTNTPTREPSLTFTKYTNGNVAPTVPGPYVAVGKTVTWTYVVTNTGGTPLDLQLVDNKLGDLTITCGWGQVTQRANPLGSLPPGQTATCTVTGVAVAGQYANVGTVTGTVPFTQYPPVTGTSTSHYFGAIFDLALRKTTEVTETFAGSDVLFKIEVINQGNVTATGVTVVDYLPVGFVKSVSDGSGWTGFGPVITKTLAGTIAPGAISTVFVLLTSDSSLPDSQATNRAEIAAAGNTVGITLNDIDSKPDNNPNNDAGGGTATDNAINGNGTGTIGGNDPATDEDDADFASLIIKGLPTAVEVLSFNANRTGNGTARVMWSTANEGDTYGYFLMRARGVVASATPSANAARVGQDLVIAQGGSASYSFADTTVPAGSRYTYWLVQVNSDGAQRAFGPVVFNGLFQVQFPLLGYN